MPLNKYTAGWNIPIPTSTDTATRRRLWNRVAGTGADLVRTDAYWPSLQPTNPGSAAAGLNDTLDATALANLDAFMDDAAARDIKVWLTAAYSPAWARPGYTSSGGGQQADHIPPTRGNTDGYPDFANFCYLIADRYASRNPGTLVAIGVWNEPNATNFWAQPPATSLTGASWSPDALEYTYMLIGAYNAIKTGVVVGRANRSPVDEVLVTAGCTAPADGSGAGDDYLPETFLDNIAFFGGIDYFDHWDHHPYCWQWGPDYVAVWNAFQQLGDLRDKLVAYGREDAKIWASEIGVVSRPDASTTDGSTFLGVSGYSFGETPGAGGWTTADNAINYTLAAQRVGEMFDAWHDLDYVGPMAWYELLDKDDGIRSNWPVDSWSNYYGFFEQGTTRYNGPAKGNLVQTWLAYAGGVATSFNDATDTNVNFDNERAVRTPEMTTTVEDIGAAVLARVKTANVATATDLGGGSTSDAKVPSQKAVKTYVDAVATGSLADWKEAVAYGTTANITLSGLGTGTGRDWASSIAADSRVVVLKQTNGAENGIYLAKSGSWVRASDADQADEISQGTAVLITNGNEPTAGGLKGTTWFCTTTGSWTPGSTSTTWVQTTAAAVIAAGSLTATQMASTFLDASTDLDGASASNTKVPTQKAVRTFVLAYAEPVTGIRSAEGLIAEQGGTLDFTGATDMTTLVTNAVNALNPGDVLQFPRGVIRLDGSGATGYGVDPTSRGVTLRGTHGATENNNPANDGIGTILRAGAAQLAVVRLGEDVSAYGGKGIEKLRIDQNSLATVGVLTESHDVTIDDISTHRPPAGGVGMYFYDDGNDANGDGHRSNIGKIICRGAYAVAGARPAGPWGASGTYDSQGLVLRDVNDYDFYSTVRVDHFIDGVVVDGAGGIGFGALHTSLGGPSAYASKAGVRFRRGAHHCWYVTPYLDNVRGGSQVVFEDGSTYYGIQFVAPHFLNGGWNVAEGGTGPGHAGLYPAVDIQLSTGSLRGVTFINPVLMAETAGHYFTAAVRAVTQASVRGLQWLYPVHRYCTTDFVLSGGGAFYPDVIGDGLVFTEGQASAGANTNDSPRSVGQTLRVISTNNTNLQGYDRYVKVTGTVTNINLPPIGGNATGTSSQHRYPGIITIRNAVTSGSITVSGRTGGTDDTIDGAATVTLANGATASFVPDGANWVQM